MTHYDWTARHRDALEHPFPEEAPMVSLLETINELTRKHATDSVLKVGVAHLILGTIRLLVGPLGRLDPGALDTQLRIYANRIGLDVDTESIDGDPL